MRGDEQDWREILLGQIRRVRIVRVHVDGTDGHPQVVVVLVS